MKRIKLGLAMASGLMAGAMAWAAGSAPADSYAKVEAASLVSSPQNSWARAILFTDVLETPPDGRMQRLDRKNYRAMKLKTAGTVWVPDDLALKFQALQTGSTYSFAGTVDQISRRYYVIVDACFTIQTADNLKELWTDMLNPPAQSAAAAQLDASSTAMQALLLEAQNSLIKLAQENNTTVAQLIEAQTDGGQRIAAHIVADALQGELRAQNKTAEELMIGAVLALLQKQAVLEESAKIGETYTAVPAAGEPEKPVETTGEAIPAEVPAPPASAPEAPPPPAPEEELPVALASELEEPAGPAGLEPMAEETPVAPLASELESEGSLAETLPPVAAPEELPPETVESEPRPALAEEPAAAGDDGSVEVTATEPVPAPPSSSRLVVPLTVSQPEITPMVSVRPTKAELAQMKKQEKAAQREGELAAKKALAEEKARKREEARKASLDAQQAAAAEQKAAAEARQAQLREKQEQKALAGRDETEKRKAEKAAQQEAAVRKAEAKARKDAEAAAKAKAKAEVPEDKAKAIDSGELPEWMQPVQY